MQRNLLSRAEEDVLAKIIEQEKRIGPGRSEYLPANDYHIQELVDIILGLDRKGYVTSTCTGSSAGAILTQQGRDYFEMKERNRQIRILSGEARALLVELIDKKDSDLASLLAAKFEGLCFNEDTRFRSTIKYLIDSGYLNIPRNGWADNVPYIASLTYEGEHYLELEKDELSKKVIPQGNTYNIHTLSAPGSNLILGNSASVTQNIDKSVHAIKVEIEKKGGEDKEDLYRLLAEAKGIAERITQKGSLPEKLGYFQRASNYFEKHGWFYSAIVQLIGSAIITLL